MAEIKRIVLHPLKPDGTIDENTNLYPKTLIDGIVDREGKDVNVATKEESDERFQQKEDGKGLSSNDYTDKDKDTVKEVEKSIRLYKYVQSQDNDVIGSAQIIEDIAEYDSGMLVEILGVSTRGANDDFSGKLVITEEPGVFGEIKLDDNSLFNGGYSPITLYQTGAVEDLTTDFYAYDNIDISHKYIERYCYAISLADFATILNNASWDGSGNPNGRLKLNHSYLAELGVQSVGWTTNKIINNPGLIFKSISSTNFAVDNLKSLGATNKATAISILSGYTNSYIIFKRTAATFESFSNYNLSVNRNYYTALEDNGISCPEYTCFKATYLSFNDTVYSKEQVDAKFQIKEGFEYAVKLSNTTIESRADLYRTLEAKGYPKIATASLTASSQESIDEGMGAPFVGDTIFANGKMGNTYGYFVLSNGALYWYTSKKVSGVYQYSITPMTLPPSLTNQSGKCVVVNDNEDGFEYQAKVIAGVEGVPSTREILSSVSIDGVEYNLQNLRLTFGRSYDEVENLTFMFALTPTVAHDLITTLNNTLTQLGMETISSPLQISNAIKSIATSDAWAVIGEGAVEQLFVNLVLYSIKGVIVDSGLGLIAPLGLSLGQKAVTYSVPSNYEALPQTKYTFSTIAQWLPTMTVTITTI